MSRIPLVPLGELAAYVNGRAFKPDEWSSHGLPIIRIQNLTDGTASFNYFPGNVDDRHRVRDGDLLVSWSASLDAFMWNRGDAVLNQHIFKVLEKRDAVDRIYLYFALREAMAEIRAQVHGATMRHITKPEFEAVKVSVPPLAEQRRLAARLTEQLAAVERARKAAEGRVESARGLAGSALLSAFVDAEWPTLSLAEVAELLPSKSVATDGDVEVTAVTTACLTESGFAPRGLKRARMRTSDASESRLAPGEILVARSNTAELVGRAALYEGAPAEIVASDLTFRIRPLQGMDASFLAAFLSQLYLRGYWRELSGGASGSMKKITRTQLAALQVSVPGELEQARVVAGMNTWMKNANSLTIAAEAELAAIEALPAALLREAFAWTQGNDDSGEHGIR